jgi:hypothetical protein
MIKFFVLTATSIAAATLSSCVTSPDGVRHDYSHKVAVGGERTRTGNSWNLNSDCTAKTVPNVRVTQKPQHGKVEIIREPLFPSSTGDYKKCSSVKVLGVVGYYTAAPSYVGQDSFTVRDSFGDGRVEDTTVTINVVR